jgi:hypothetical protein
MKPSRPTRAPQTAWPTLNENNVQNSFHHYAYDDALSSDSIIRYGLYIEGAIYVIFSIPQLLGAPDIGLVKVTLIYMVWLIIEIVILGARANFFFHHGAKYEAYILKHGELVYIKEAIRHLSDQSRKSVGCPYNLEDSHPAPEKMCSYWFLDFNPNLISQGWVQFSLGIGLIVAIILRMVSFGFKICLECADDDASQNETRFERACSKLCTSFFVTLVELFLHFQQFISLLPFEVILPNAYCLEVQVPVATMKAICRYKLAAAAIPIGMPIAIAGLGVAFVCFSIVQTNGSDNGASCGFAIFGLPFLFIGLFGFTIVIFWMFGGIVLGFWS